MAKEILIEPEDCWDYFLEHKEDLVLEEHIIGQDKDYGIEICMASDLDMPRFTVYLDGDTIHEDYVVYAATAPQECTDIVSEIYSDYLDDIESTLQKEIDKQIMEQADDQEWDALIEHYDQEEEIKLQESQINDSVEELLDLLCDGFARESFTPKEFEDIKDHICEYVARKHKKKVYRPMYLEGEDGKDFYTKFPYENMIFDDPDNPLYA